MVCKRGNDLLNAKTPPRIRQLFFGHHRGFRFISLRRAESSMASVSLEHARRAIQEDGFFVLTDPAVGERVREMERLNLPYTSEYGLDFCKANVLDDTVG